MFAMCDVLFGSSLGLFSRSSCFLGGSLDSLFLFRSLDSLVAHDTHGNGGLDVAIDGDSDSMGLAGQP